MDDNVQRNYSPRVAVYLDNTFGTLMFQDPDAPCNESNLPCRVPLPEPPTAPGLEAE